MKSSTIIILVLGILFIISFGGNILQGIKLSNLNNNSISKTECQKTLGVQENKTVALGNLYNKS